MTFWKSPFLAVCLGALVACGGSGGGGTAGPSLAVDTHQLTVTGNLHYPAPTGTVNLTVNAPVTGTEYYVACKSTTHGIGSVALGSPSGYSMPIQVYFADPTALGLGTYNDTLELFVTTDLTGTNQIAGSPQTIAVTYTVSPPVPPTITSFSPATVAAGGPGFTLTINGTQFQSGTQVQWNGSNRRITLVSDTQLTIPVTATDIETAGTATVTASDATFGGGVSTPATFTIGAPAFGISSVLPSTVQAGGPGFTLIVIGAQFQSGSTVQWNGSARTTTYVSPTQLTAQILASDIAATGTAAVTVLNPGGASGACPVTINTGDAVAWQIDPSHSGAIAFPSMTLPAASLWSVTLDGPPSYPLIAQGNVYVTLPVSGSSELMALSQTTGAVVWGPKSFPGMANAAYDNGQVFVLSGPGPAGPAAIQAFDAATGLPGWSSVLPGGYGAGAPPTAANGTVFATGWGGTLAAFSAADGALLWTASGGQGCSPAVSASAVYLSYALTATALDPVTGAAIWYDNLGGDGGGGATPVLANGLLYAPDGAATYSGQVLEAATGVAVGTYSADVLPAIATQTGYFLQGGTLRAVRLSDDTILWSFAGDDHLVTSPIVVNHVVFIGSSSGNLYGLDATTGTQVWEMTLGAALPAGAAWFAQMPFTGMAAGDGLLVAPAGNTLTAYLLAPAP